MRQHATRLTLGFVTPLGGMALAALCLVATPSHAAQEDPSPEGQEQGASDPAAAAEADAAEADAAEAGAAEPDAAEADAAEADAAEAGAAEADAAEADATEAAPAEARAKAAAEDDAGAAESASEQPAPPPVVDSLPKTPSAKRKAVRDRKGPRPATGDQATPDTSPGLEFDMVTAISGAVGCAICGGPPLLIAAGCFGLGAFTAVSGLAQGGCGGAIGLVVGLVLATLGLLPAAVGGVSGPLGVTVSTAGGRWYSDRACLFPTLAALLGVVPGIVAAGLTAGGLAALVLIVEADDDRLSEYGGLALLGGGLAILAMALIAGPLAWVAANVTASWVDDAPNEMGREAPPPRRAPSVAMRF